MSKESQGRNTNDCPKCHRAFAFMEYHIPHCQGAGLTVAQIMARDRLVKAAAEGGISEAGQKKVAQAAERVLVKSALDTTHGPVKDEKLKSTRKGKAGAKR